MGSGMLDNNGGHDGELIGGAAFGQEWRDGYGDVFDWEGEGEDVGAHRGAQERLAGSLVAADRRRGRRGSAATGGRRRRRQLGAGAPSSSKQHQRTWSSTAELPGNTSEHGGAGGHGNDGGGRRWRSATDLEGGRRRCERVERGEMDEDGGEAAGARPYRLGSPAPQRWRAASGGGARGHGGGDTRKGAGGGGLGLCGPAAGKWPSWPFPLFKFSVCFYFNSKKKRKR